MTDELVAEYAKVLKVLTEDDLSMALDLAARENDSNYAPAPGVVMEIVQELIRGRRHPVLAEMSTWTTPSKEERDEMIQSPEWQALKKAVGRK